MFGAGLHEDRAPFRDPYGLALDLEHAIALEHHIDLVVRVRLLPIRLRGHKHVDAELEARLRPIVRVKGFGRGCASSRS